MVIMMITGPMMTGPTYGASSKKPGTSSSSSSSSSGSHVKKPGVGGSVKPTHPSLKPTHPSVGGTLTIPGRPLLQDERYFLL